jgi:integrase/recombinase XerC
MIGLGNKAKSAYNPARAFKIKRQHRELTHVIDVDLINALLMRPTRYEHAAKLWTRDKAIMELFYSSGLRVSELSNVY